MEPTFMMKLEWERSEFRLFLSILKQHPAVLRYNVEGLA
jgi:hypothetical protein